MLDAAQVAPAASTTVGPDPDPAIPAAASAISGTPAGAAPTLSGGRGPESAGVTPSLSGGRGPESAGVTPAYWRWRRAPVAPGRAVVFDVDGVLSDAAGRQHFVTGKKRDWDAFFDAVGDDAVIPAVAKVLTLLDPVVLIVLLTGRPLRVQPQTVTWLAQHGLRWDLLIMRPSGDYAAARSFKRRSIAELRAYGMQLELAFEDDRRNLDMFQAQGVPCLYVHSGYYD